MSGSGTFGCVCLTIGNRSRRSALERKAAALRRQGWGEAKIERWLHDHLSAEAKQVPWGDAGSLEAKDQLLARYRASTRFGRGTGEFDLWLDHQTALAFIDDAEGAGLVAKPIEFGHLEENGRIRVFAYEPNWEEALTDTHAREGRAAVVRTAAQMARDFILPHFPHNADVVIFAIS